VEKNNKKKRKEEKETEEEQERRHDEETNKENDPISANQPGVFHSLFVMSPKLHDNHVGKRHDVTPTKYY